MKRFPWKGNSEYKFSSSTSFRRWRDTHIWSYFYYFSKCLIHAMSNEMNKWMKYSHSILESWWIIFPFNVALLVYVETHFSYLLDEEACMKCSSYLRFCLLIVQRGIIMISILKLFRELKTTACWKYVTTTMFKIYMVALQWSFSTQPWHHRHNHHYMRPLLQGFSCPLAGLVLV